MNLQKLLLSRTEAAEMMGMSLNSFERYVQHDLRLVRKGRMRLVPVRELEKWVEKNAGQLVT